MNVVQPILAQARAAPGAPAVFTSEGTLSRAELERAVRWTAAELRREGVRAGDLAGIAVASQLQHLVAALALARLGAGQVPFGPGDGPLERREIVRRLGVGTTVGDAVPGGLHELKALKAESIEPESGGALPFLVVRSSGTTGTPKLGLFTHDKAAHHLLAYAEMLPYGAHTRILSMARISFPGPILHAFRCLASGGCVVLPDGVKVGEEIEFIDASGANNLAGAPVHAAALLEAAGDRVPALPGVEVLRLSTALVPEALRREVRARLTPNLYILYGITEIGAISVASPALAERLPGTVGTVVRGMEIEIADSEGRPVPPGERGLLRARSAGMIDGYIGQPEESARVFRGGWFHSSDLVERTAEGALVHHGRADDVMIYDGINIYPSEIESALLRHPAVGEAAAFGVPSRSRGEVPAAAVVLRSPASEAQLLKHSRDWLGARAPVRVLVVKELPRNAAGKVLRRELAARARAKT